MLYIFCYKLLMQCGRGFNVSFTAYIISIYNPLHLPLYLSLHFPIYLLSASYVYALIFPVASFIWGRPNIHPDLFFRFVQYFTRILTLILIIYFLFLTNLKSGVREV